MPRLPSVESLGARPVPSVPGGIASYRLPGTGQTAEAIARGGAQLSQIGEQIENARTQARRSAQLNDAMGEATLALGELENKYQRDQDFATSPKRFAEDAELLRQRIETKVDDEGVRAAFNQKYNDLAIAKKLNVLTSATKQEGDYHVSRLDDTLDVYSTAAANAQNPTEVALIEGQAEIAISDLQRAGWIRDVDASKRRKGFASKIDQAVVLRDMGNDALDTVTRLANDPKYAPNIDPLQRERMIDAGYRRAEAERAKADALAEKERRELADGIDKDFTDAFAKGGLTPQMVRDARPLLSHSQYRHWVDALNSPAGKDDKTALGDVLTLLHPPTATPPDESRVRESIFSYMRQGRLSPTTAKELLNNLRSQERAEGPKSPYEQAKSYITDKLAGNIFALNPRGQVADGISKLDAWVTANQGKYTPEQLVLERDRIIKEVSGVGNADPKQRVEQYRREITDLNQRKADNKISADEYRKKLDDLTKLIQALEVSSGKR